MKIAFYFLLSCLALQSICSAQNKYSSPKEFWNDVSPTFGPAKIDLFPNATIEIPKGYLFLGKKDSKKFAAFTENISNDGEVVIMPQTGEWFATFNYEDSGYIKEEKIDSESLFKSMKDGEPENNRERSRLGYPKLYLQDWFMKPSYNPKSNNLEWAFLIKDEEGDYVVNYDSRILGRTGYIQATLVMDPSKKSAVPAFQNVLDNLEFKAGSRYAEWKPGDKVAKYGMAALITGGAIAAAAKTGILAKFWKLIVAGVVAVFAAIGKFFKKLSGKE